MLCRTVYGAERICHTCDIRSNTAHFLRNIKHVQHSAGFSFSMLTKTYLSPNKIAHETENSNARYTRIFHLKGVRFLFKVRGNKKSII